MRRCHSLGFMHRDLKPENILLATPDSDTAVKVIDFGVAAAFKPGQRRTLTRVTHVTPWMAGSPPWNALHAGQKCVDEVGTPFYLAPEVLQLCYGPEADIWSAGVVLYILLSGGPPFWAKTNQGIREAIKRRMLELSGGPWTNISESAKDLIRAMLTMDPEQRIKPEAILDHPWIMEMVS